jgi:hypothetical protein
MDIVMRPWIAPYRTSWTAPPSYLEESLLLACIQSLSPPLEDWVGFDPPVVRAMAAVLSAPPIKSYLADIASFPKNGRESVSPIQHVPVTC